MELIEVEGIVVSESPYSESSKIINIITREFGIIGIMAKGANKLKSKLRNGSSKLSYATFNISYKEKGLSTLVEVNPINNLKNIKTDINKISFAYYIIDLVKQVVKHEYNEQIYNILVSAILKIEEGFDPQIITNILELKMLDYLGVRPVIDECASCGSKTNIITISGDRGGYLCQNCRQNEYIVSDKTIKLIRMFYYVDISKISKLEISKKSKGEIDMFINEYYDRYTGLYLKSKSFIKSLERLNINWQSDLIVLELGYIVYGCDDKGWNLLAIH